MIASSAMQNFGFANSHADRKLRQWDFVPEQKKWNMRWLFSIALLPVLAGCDQTSPVPSQSLAPQHVREIAERIDQHYPQQPVSERQALLQQAVTAIDNMVFVEGGTFEMGDFGWVGQYDPTDMCEWPCGVPRDELWFLVPKSDSRPLHTVRLDSFYMAKYHTTIAEDDRFRYFTGLPVYRMELTEEDLRDGLTKPSRERSPELYLPDYPARSKLWQEAKDYCLWLGELSGLSVDLPTEAQYEYAARSKGRYVVYSTDTGSIARGENVHDGQFIYPVGYFPPNPLGLYEMGENAVSWVNDWYAADYYQNSPIDNPRGPETGTEKVRRGSDSLSSPQLAMTMWRRSDKPVRRDYYAQSSFRCSIQQSGPLK
ncbi:formylglycine-generating enzyme family protein [Pseudomonas vanderleydeniana]|nr:SUMF1/EgtB/PvdO family nonheme iron enzyme [Pseudomonas vanderleydeniana]